MSIILKESLNRFNAILDKHNLFNHNITIKIEPVSYNGYKKISAYFADSIGEAFTINGKDFFGTINNVINLPLNSDENRAIVVATINAVLRHLKFINNTIHCSLDESNLCAKEMAERLYGRWGEGLTIGIIGFNPSIVNAILEKLPEGNVQIGDFNNENIEKEFNGTIILNANRYLSKIVANNFLALVSGISVVNDSVDEILETHKKNNKNRIVIFYGTTIAGIDKLMNLRRLCFNSH